MRPPRTTPRRRTLRGALAAVISALLIVTGLSVAPAMAVTGDMRFETSMPSSGTIVGGTEYTASLVFKVEPYAGKTVTIGYPSQIENADVLAAKLKELVAIDKDSVSIDPVTRQVTFTVAKDSPMNQAVIDFSFVVADPESSLKDEKITWSIDGTPSTSTVTIRKKSDEPSPVWQNSQNKSSNSNDLWKAVSIDANRKVTVTAPEGATIGYTISIDADTARTINLSDVIGDGLDIIPSSVVASISSWTDGLNKVTANVPVTATADGLDATIAMPADSRATISYKARMNSALLEQIRVALQQQLDEADPDNAVALTWPFTNTASTGENGVKDMTTSDNLNFTVNAPQGPDLNAAFGKSASVSGATAIEVGADGTLVNPIDVNYTLKANLTQFTGKPASKSPDRNIVITDDRNGKDAIQWVRGADFVTDGGTALTEAADGLTEDEFADLGAGWYRVRADGALQINVGNDKPYADHTFVVKARITDVSSLTPVTNPSGNALADKEWTITNRSVTKFREENGGHVTRTTDFWLYTEKDVSNGIDNKDAFSKSTVKETQIGADGVAWVPFVFKTNWQNKYDVTKSTIVDEIDHSIFNVTADNLEAITNTISGSFAGVTFVDGDVDIALVDGNLELTLSDAFVAKNPYIYKTGNLDLTVNVPTFAVEGRTTIDFTNTARLYGEDGSSFPWVSTSTASATSYSSELEVQKVLYQGNGTWGNNLRAKFDAEGNLVDDDFIYRILLRPHGTFNGKTIIPIEDVLPAGLEWQGFVQDKDLDAKKFGTEKTYNLGGGITATWGTSDDGKDALILSGRINTEVPLTVNFLVKVIDWTEDVSIVNAIGSAKATITPSDGFPLIIQKVDSTNPDKVITDEKSRFRVDKLEENGTYTLITDQGYLRNGNVVVNDAAGNPKSIVVEKTGTYRVSEMKAPAGYEAVIVSTDGTTSNKTATIVVAESGTKGATIVNTPAKVPAVKNYAIGDYVWYDDDKDGKQGKDEAPVPGVTVALLNGDGTPVLGTDGQPVTTTTDENGKYVFDELPAGEYRVQFTLPEDIAADYVFTDVTAGDDVKVDSDANPANGRTGVIVLGDDNEQLIKRADVKATQGIDPTWDAGIVKKPVPLTYAIGDYTWIDTNKDGIQDSRESVLAGMIVRLLDAEGTVLATTTTNGVGLYLFDELAAGQYQVEFEIPENLRTTYAFTKSDTPATAEGISVGANDDSDAAVTDKAFIGRTGLITLDATNTELTTAYDAQTVKATAGIDPTWDAGVIVKKVSVGDYVWIDENKDGLQDEGEPGIPGVVLELRDPQGKPVLDEFGEPKKTTTGPNGEYLFDSLPALKDGETYTVVIDPKRPENVTALEGLTPTRDDQPGDKNSSTWSATSVPTLTTDGAHDPTLDFGFTRIPEPVKTYAIGDYTWIDANKDGKQSEGESVIAGIVVRLLDAEGKVVGTTTTDKNGLYLFDELAAGQYVVEFEIPESLRETYAFTSADVKGGANEDSDAAATDKPFIGRTGAITLDETNTELTTSYKTQSVKATQGIDPTWDAGLVVIEKPVEPQPVKKVSVGDYVWIDENGDGLQDDGEPGIPGIVLELLGPDGTPVLDENGKPKTTTTGPNGEYLFDNLPALEEGQTYTVIIDPKRPENVTALEGLTPTRDDQPGDKNSSTWTATSVPTLTTDGAHDPTLDFGFTRIPEKVKTYAVGDYVWIDADKDGVQDANEKPLAGVIVELLQDGYVIATTTTDANGRYIFDELTAGTYRVRFTLTEEQQDLYAFTTAMVGGSTAGADSNADVKTGLTKTFVLDGTNTALTKDYTDLAFLATEGVDPTWDAGVILRSTAPGEEVEEKPEEEETGSNIVTPSPNPSATAGAPGDALSVTGQSVPLGTILVALMTLFAGLALVARRTLVRR